MYLQLNHNAYYDIRMQNDDGKCTCNYGFIAQFSWFVYNLRGNDVSKYLGIIVFYFAQMPIF